MSRDNVGRLQEAIDTAITGEASGQMGLSKYVS